MTKKSLIGQVTRCLNALIGILWAPNVWDLFIIFFRQFQTESIYEVAIYITSADISGRIYNNHYAVHRLRDLKKAQSQHE